MADQNYKTISRPYDDFLERNTGGGNSQSSSNTPTATGPEGNATQTPAGEASSGNGSVESMPGKSDGSFGDLWIKTFIRSQNWKPKTRGFYLDGRTGYGEFTNVFVSGEIVASTGEIGGFTIGATELFATQGIFKTSVSSGELAFSTGPEADPNIKIFRAGTMEIGTENPIIIDGLRTQVRSEDYASGAFGKGFLLSPDLLEVGNIACRGMFRTAVFQKDIINVISGSFVVAPNGDVLDEDMTASDSSTLKIKGTVTLALGDILHMREVNGATVDDEWLVVTGVADAPVYQVARDYAGTYAANSNPEWKKGTAVVDYGQTGDGGVYMTASDSGAPYLSVFDHDGSPWLNLFTRLRLGNLNGFLGYNTNVYGIAIGDADRYMKYDQEGGLQIRGNILITNPGDINTSDLNNDAGWSSGGVNTFLQDSTPVSLGIGDIWINTGDGNKMYVAASVGADQIAPGEWEIAGNGSNIFAQETPPVSLAVNDLWYDTLHGNKLYKAMMVGADQIAPGEWEEVSTLFDNIASIPSPLLAPSGDGLYINADHIGFFQDSVWKTYMDNQGNFMLGDIEHGGAGLSWNQSTADFVVKGTITADAGFIGGWVIGATTLADPSGNVEMDSANSRFVVRDSSDNIVILLGIA